MNSISLTMASVVLALAIMPPSPSSALGASGPHNTVTVENRGVDTVSITRGFAAVATVEDMYTVEAANLTRARGLSKDVKDFAARSLATQTEFMGKLRAALASKHPSTYYPARLDKRHQLMVSALRNAGAAEFDGRFITQQIDTDQEAVRLLDIYISDGDIPAIKTLAASTIPTVREQLSIATKMQASLRKTPGSSKPSLQTIAPVATRE